jgi:hypothetical protein
MDLTNDNEVAAQTPSVSAVTPANTDESFNLDDTFPQQQFIDSPDFLMIGTPGQYLPSVKCQ